MPDRCLCMKEPSENLLKMTKAECAWIIILSFNSNRKFLMNKNMCLNALKTAEIDKYQLNSFINVMKISISLSASVFKSDEPDYLLHQFVSIYNKVHSVKLLKKINDHIIAVLNFY